MDINFVFILLLSLALFNSALRSPKALPSKPAFVDP